MRTTMKKAISHLKLFLAPLAALAFATACHASSPGITGPSFSLVAGPAYISQPDGASVYSWGYGCNGAPSGYAPAAITVASCGAMQVPGPTLIVTEGQSVSITLTNNLPQAAGNTSILFPGFTVTTDCGTSGAASVQGLLTCEAVPGKTVTYTFTAASPGTRAYYSGTQGDLQIEMGMYGAIIVLPKTIPTACTTGLRAANRAVEQNWGESDFRLAAAAYNNANACYDREYLFQFSEMDPKVHTQALAQSTLACVGCMSVQTEPYHPSYFMINGRSMPDDMDPNYASQYPHQPYNGDPHMHPGELVLLRIIGQGRWQHPFHEHGNHVRILGRDGNLLLSQTDSSQLSGPLLFTTTTTPGLAMDGIFYWTGKGLNWDAYGHHPGSSDPSATLSCVADANGYNTGTTTAESQINYYEWCQDHNKPMQALPFGDVAGGGPMTLPDPTLFTNGPWYGGSPYLGPDATVRATGCYNYTDPTTGTVTQTNAGNCGATGTTPPSGTIANNPSSEAGFAFMWHSHNEREITTNNIFPGGMLMMMLVDSREFQIDETN